MDGSGTEWFSMADFGTDDVQLTSSASDGLLSSTDTPYNNNIYV